MDPFRADSESEEEFNESDKDCGILEKSSHLTAGTPALCNLPSHSPPPSHNCWRNEKVILEQAAPSVVAWPSLSEPRRGHQRSRELWLRYSLIRQRAPYPSPAHLSMKASLAAWWYLCRGGSLFSSQSSSLQDGVRFSSSGEHCPFYRGPFTGVQMQTRQAGWTGANMCDYSDLQHGTLQVKQILSKKKELNENVDGASLRLFDQILPALLSLSNSSWNLWWIKWR